MARAISKDELTGKKTIEVEEEKRYSIPQEDDDGTIPEFVNITGKTQIIAVPYEPTESIRVPPWGILTGSQWRKPYASANKKWRFPPFRERVKTDEKYDEKYILSEKQVLTELEKLWTNDPDDTDRVKKRIQSLVDNMVIGKDGVRHMDDRVSVLTMMTDKIRKLEAKREQVLNGVGR
ncbi:MAG: hypothetical protein ACTSYJ_07290 [Candidatus Thorarchaeota archaeon]